MEDETLPPCTIGYPTTGDVYYAVAYLKNGVIDIRPAKTQEEALDILKRLISYKNGALKNRIKRTTVIRKDVSRFKNGYIFGCPKCFNLIEGEDSDGN